ncbi:related to RNA splicing endonuclease gamma subunit [Sporisorium reilianum f. sp. reilianum]|uniref:tRNA-splicing endonuclease subunit Sen34 n=1 Tax=Sporisorium reilianum f. sp. reilianum TaxID=72559 RepID=A0A2N8U8B2_9BASI|nr:related to RNA splicing endonuclease gamma subunit [Sporisorium reilianum f. sp. reilianum]
MSSSSSANTLASHTIHHLSTHYPHRVQIHLHPSTSLPPSLSSLLPAPSTRGDLPVALVWTVDSVRLMRTYGVTGSFTGTLAQFPQQNVFLGMPVQLMPEEVVYLLRRARAVVVDEAGAYRASTGGERDEVRSTVKADRQGQQLDAWNERLLLRARHSSTPLNPAPPTQKDLEALPWHYTIPTTSTPLPWYTPTAHTTLSAIQPLFPYPTTPLDIGRTALFEHLRAQHLWCLNGLRFGGTFAVYPGDPLRYHSHYTAQLVLSGESVPVTALVANGRLGTAVKKTHLVCCVRDVAVGLDGEEEKGRRAVVRGDFDVAVHGGEGTTLATFDVFSLAWAGFGT